MTKAERALRNRLLLAMREKWRESMTSGTSTEVETAWDHIIRYCSEGGIKPSPLRDTPTVGEKRVER